MSVVVAVRAPGSAVPPLIVLSGILLLDTELAALSIDGTRVKGCQRDSAMPRSSRTGLRSSLPCWNPMIYKTQHFWPWINLPRMWIRASFVSLFIIILFFSLSVFVGYCFIESVNFCCEHGILMIALPETRRTSSIRLTWMCLILSKQSSVSVYSFKIMKRWTQLYPNRQPSILRVMHAVSPSSLTLKM